MIIEFTIPGLPQPQGSKTRSRYGGLYEDNPKLISWRNDAIAAAVDAKPEGKGATFLGAVEVRARFVFPRLKGHYGTGRNARVLKDSAPYWHSTKPDEDKLERALGDALTMAQVVRDDCQIACWIAEKVYGDLPRVDVRIRPLTAPATSRQLPLAEPAGSLMDELVDA
jgi:Holliday junction resolvase RusA-like endonuclease